MTDDEEKEIDKLFEELLSKRKYIMPKNLKRIENDEGWSNLVGPSYMQQLREMYEIPEHKHTNGLMSCSTCVYLVFQYEKDIEELEKQIIA